MTHKSTRARIASLYVAALLVAAGGLGLAYSANPLIDSLPTRNIGPASMGGRIVDIEGVESDPKTIYVAAATGGLWKTTNGGDNWMPLFDEQSTLCMGDIAVSQSNPNIVWVGTGEANARNSVSWGDGMYKSVDAGKTWQNMGLKQTRHIGRVIIHPTNPDIVYVAAMGDFWGPNKERGIFKTTDGGRTWEVSKYISEETGFIDLAMDPSDPNILYGTAYRVRRDAFAGGNPATETGANGGLYKTVDGGKIWEKLAGGLPDRPLGRCGITIHRADPNILYAVVQTDMTNNGTTGQPASGGRGGRGGRGGLDEEILEHLREEGSMDPERMERLMEGDAEEIEKLREEGTLEEIERELKEERERERGGRLFSIVARGGGAGGGGGGGGRGGRGGRGGGGEGGGAEAETETETGGEGGGAAAGGGRGGAGGGRGGAAGGRGNAPAVGGENPGIVDLGGIFRSNDKGKTWTKVNDLVPRPFYYGQIRVDPKDPNRLYVIGTQLATSDDGGRTFAQGAVLAPPVPTTQPTTGPATRGAALPPGAAGEGTETVATAPATAPTTQLAGGEPTTSPATGPATQAGGRGRGGRGGGGGAGNVHVDHHAMWIDPNDTNTVWLGNDGGVYVSKNKGRNWEAIRGMPLAQFYGIAVDMRTPYRVYGGLQDNGSWAGPSATSSTEGIVIADWRSLLGGDGFEAASDPRNPDLIYFESQNGALSRIIQQPNGRGQATGVRPPNGAARGRGGRGGRGGAATAPATGPATEPATAPATGAATQTVAAVPTETETAQATQPGAQATQPGAQANAQEGGAGAARGGAGAGRGGAGGGRGGGGGAAAPNPYRFNWDSPFMISPHDPDTLLMGGNVLFKTTNRGDTWSIISPDLTRGAADTARDTAGGGARNTLTTIAQSPLNAEVIWVGSDCGRIHVTLNGGKDWTELNIPGMPNERWINRLEASYAAEGTAYLAIDRHRNSDLKPYLFKTTDYGTTWTSLAEGLPPEAPVHVVRESSKNKNLLFVGTENGLFISLNGGAKWDHIKSGMPGAVPVYDLVIHPRERELVIGTHGRSVYVMDVGPLEQMSPEVLAAAAYLFDQKTALLVKTQPPAQPSKASDYKAPNPPAGAVIYYYMGKAVEGATLSIVDQAGKVLATLPAAKEAGLHRLVWDPSTTGLVGEALKGLKLNLKVGTETVTKPLQVEEQQ